MKNKKGSGESAEAGILVAISATPLAGDSGAPGNKAVSPLSSSVLSRAKGQKGESR